MPEVQKVWRLLKVVQLVVGNENLSAGEIAERVGVHRRTFHRYKDTLEKAGISIYHDGEGYKLAGPPFLPAVELSMDEALALMLTVEGALDSHFIPYPGSLKQALEKIKSGIPPSVQQRINESVNEVDIRQHPMVDMSEHTDSFKLLLRATEVHRVVYIEYLGRTDDEPTARHIEPLHVLQRWRAWYVVAYCRLRKDIRMFRIDRMLRVELTEREFVPPKDFDFDEFLENAWVVEHGREHTIRIQFSDAAARLVKELTWHPTQKVEEISPGTVIVTFKTGGLNEVAEWLMHYGDQARVLSPSKLREMVKRRARQILEVYQ